MKKVLPFILLGLVSSVSLEAVEGLHAVPLKESSGKPLFVENELLVKFHPRVPQHAIDRFNASQGVKGVVPLPFGIVKLQLPDQASPQAAAARYKENPNVMAAHPNYIAYAAMTPNDPMFQYQWNFDNITNRALRMTEVWDESNAGTNAVVAVLDTGIAYEDYDAYRKAPDLAGTHFIAGYDFINHDAHANDDQGHGTHVAGTIAQSTNNAYGVSGITYNASLMPVKVLGSDGSGALDALISGIDFVVNGADGIPDSGDEARVDVINMSLSFGTNDVSYSLLNTALDAAYQSGIIIIAASGNDGQTDFVSYPANYPYVVAVGATDFFEHVTDYSNKGAALELTAPGGDNSQDLTPYGHYQYGGILQQTLYVNPNSRRVDPSQFDWYFYEGTSMATPHVAAVAALIREVNPSLTPAQVRSIMQDTAKDLGAPGHDTQYGYGIVNPYDAIMSARTTLGENHAAVITSTTIPTTVEEDAVVTFSVTATDADDDPLTYRWEIDGLTQYGATVNHTFGWGDDVEVAVIVDDLRGGVTMHQQTVHINEHNDIPQVVHNGPFTATTDSTVSFSAAGTTDYDNEDGTTANDQALSYHWEFGDGQSAEGISVTHAYTSEGNYAVSLSVNDTGLAADTITVDTEALITASQPVAPAAPSALTASVDGSHVHLQWQDNADNETGYTLERAMKIRGKYTFAPIVDVDAMTTEYTDTVDATGTYKYRVQAFNSESGLASDYSDEVSVTVDSLSPVIPDPEPDPGTLSAPLLNISAQGYDVTLTWSHDCSGYEPCSYDVERGDAKTRGVINYGTYTSTSGNTLTLTESSGTFYYRIKAYGGNSDPVYSNEVSVRLK